MAQLSELKLSYRILMEAYPYRRIDWKPSHPLRKPLSQARIAVVTSAAFYLPEQKPFDESIRGGDFSYRVIETGADLSRLRIGHRSDAFDHSGIEADPNLALPLDRLAELAQDGVIGSIAPRHFSFMGSLTAPGRLISLTAPAAAGLLRDDGVDGVILTPV